MARNYVQDGENLTVTAPYAVASGAGVLVGAALFGIALAAAASGAQVVMATEGVWDVSILSTDVVAAGDLLYWDNTNKRLTTTATGNLKVGVAVADKAAGVAVARIKLNEAN